MRQSRKEQFEEKAWLIFLRYASDPREIGIKEMERRLDKAFKYAELFCEKLKTYDQKSEVGEHD